MARSKDAGDRQAVLKVLKVVRESTLWLTRRWDVTGRLFDHDAPRDVLGNVLVRERREDEYPENSVEEWELLVKTIDDQRHGLAKLREFAVMQAERKRVKQWTPAQLG